MLIQIIMKTKRKIQSFMLFMIKQRKINLDKDEENICKRKRAVRYSTQKAKKKHRLGKAFLVVGGGGIALSRTILIQLFSHLK